MAVIDLTDDASAQAQVAFQAGRGVGSIINGFRKRSQIAEQKQRRQIQQAQTIKLLNSGLQGQELLAAMNEMPGAVDNQLTQSFNQQALAQRASGRGNTTDRDVSELEKLNNMRSKLHKWDGTLQQFILVPGGEEILKGIDMGIKNVTTRIVAAEKARTAGVEDVAGVAREQLGIEGDTQAQPAGVQPQPSTGGRTLFEPTIRLKQRLEGFAQDEKRNFLDDTISKENVIATIRELADDFVKGGLERKFAQNKAIQEYIKIIDEDQGTFQKFPSIDIEAVFDETDTIVAGAADIAAQTMTATNPKTGERVISRDGGKTWQPAP